MIAASSEAGTKPRDRFIFLQWDDKTNRFIDYTPDVEEQREVEALINTPGRPELFQPITEKDATAITQLNTIQTNTIFESDIVNEISNDASEKTLSIKTIAVIGIIAIAGLIVIFLKKRKKSGTTD